MSDFFTRLAERTLGLALTIQPIKPSLFAQEPDYDGETLLEIAEESEVAQAFSGTPPHAEIPTLPPNSSKTAEQEHDVELSITRSERAQAAQVLPAATPGNNMNDTRPRSTIKQQQLARDNHRHVPATEPRSANIAQDLKVTSNTVLSYPLIEQEHNNDAPQRSTISDGNNTSEKYSEATTIVETSTLLHRQTTSYHEQTLSHHAILGERSRRDLQAPISIPTASAQPEALQVEPTIQVTIGRVEVRAVTTPAPTASSPHQPTRSAAMSLEEYLRRQEQGGRR